MIASLAITVLLAGIGLACWASSHEPPRPHRTVDQVLDDVARYRTERLIPELDQLLTCEALYATPSQRKEES